MIYQIKVQSVFSVVSGFVQLFYFLLRFKKTHKSHHFNYVRVYNLVIFTIFTMCSHDYYVIPEYFYHPQKEPHTH